MSKEQSKDGGEESWNMASAYLRRVDRLLTLCIQASMMHDVASWSRGIDGLYKEIYPKMTDKEKETASKLRNKMYKQLKNPDYQHQKKGGVVAVYPQKPFLDFELFLRGLLEKKNLLTPKGADPTKSFTNG